MDGSSLNLVMSAPYTVTDTDDISEAEDKMNNIPFNIPDYATVTMVKITYDQLISISDDHLMEICKDSATE